MNSSSWEFPELLGPVVALVEQAGELLIQEWEREGGPRGLEDKAEVDSEIEWLLRDGLLNLWNADFWGEETGQSMTGAPFCWVVDPHDGTSDFLRGLPGSSISVALLHEQKPVLGVVYAPISPDRGRDCIAWAEGLPHLIRNGQPWAVDLSQRKLTKDSLVWLSASAASKPLKNIELCHPARFIAMPSIAYRLARAAAGDGDCAVSLVGLSAHDVAGGHALLRGARGSLLTQDGLELSYEDMWEVSRRCFGGAPEVCQTLMQRRWSDVLVAPRHPLRRKPGSQHFPSIARMQRAAGCLVGLLAGDNLGAQVEFMSASEIAEYCRKQPLQMEDGGVWNIHKGQPTDDGELALALARSLNEAARYDHEGIAEAFATWLASDPFDVGMATEQALSGPQRYPNMSMAQACAISANDDSQANGALMRVAPIGIAAHCNPQQAASWARQNAALTHPHAVCLEANAAFAAAIATAIGGGSRKVMSEAALSVLAHDERSESAAIVEQRILSGLQGFRPDDYQAQMGWVLIALQNAFYHLAAGHDVERAIIETIRQGGDTDTNACIVGALIGAVEGVQALPAPWSLAIQSARPNTGRRARPISYWPDDSIWLAQALLATTTAPSLGIS